MTDLEREIALAISPNIVEPVPEEWLPEARRAIRAMANFLREHDRTHASAFPLHTITSHWLLEQINDHTHLDL
jgi:hypothetical protein